MNELETETVTWEPCWGDIYISKVAVADRAGNILNQPGIRNATLSQRAYIRAAAASRDHVDPVAFLRADRQRRNRDCFLLKAGDEPAPTVSDALQAIRRRAWEAPMATRDLHAVDRTTILLARALAWAGGLALIAGLAWWKWQ
jgi:hypothetical protein